MPNIQVLDQNTINKIAAGEVIERPASVVKELLENAIDAKATAVTIEIKEGGISFIRITDNGCGIAREEIPLAFLRHSTSKIRSVEDLMTVASLGFRGEALSSIAAVSQVELITKEPASLNGSRYCIEGGVEKINEEIGCPEGTTFLVRNLFYNTPARKKFLKTPQTEASYISDIIEKIALSHPDVSIRFINNSQNKLHTSGNHNLRDVIYGVYGKEITANLLPVQAQIEEVSITGFVGKPAISRGNRTYENYYINGRYIKSSMIAKAIEEAYQSFLMQHKYPFVVLHIQIDSNLLDVNVHPTKMELRIGNAETVYQFLYHTIRNILSESELIPEISLKKQEEEKEKEKENQVVRERGSDYVSTQPSLTEKRQEKTERLIPKEQPTEQMELFDDRLLSKKSREHHRMIGQIFDTYWLVEYQNKLFFIDQHAAHEKVLYEKTMQSLKTREYTSQMVNPPIVLTLSMKEEELLKRYLSYFEKIGFEIEPFGGKEYTIRAVPDNLFGIAQQEIFIEMLDDLGDDMKSPNPQVIYEKVAMMSCKAAVKGKKTLSVAEADALIGELLELENPYHCPHGRPTILSMTRHEIEKKFKRIV